MHMHLLLTARARTSARPFILQSPCRVSSVNTLVHFRNSLNQPHSNRQLHRVPHENDGVQPDPTLRPSKASDVPSPEQISLPTFRYSSYRPRKWDRERQSTTMPHRIKLYTEEEDGDKALVEWRTNSNREQSQDEVISNGPTNVEDSGDLSDFIDDLQSLVRQGLPITSSRIDLPPSPLLNPTQGKRKKKDRPSKDLTSFQRKLATNPYANALATPVRVCQLTKTAMPKYFLQKIRLVMNKPGKASAHQAQYIPGHILSTAEDRFYRREEVHEVDEVDESLLEQLKDKAKYGLDMSEENHDHTEARGIGIDIDTSRYSSSSGAGVYVLARNAAISALADSKLGEFKFSRRVLIPPTQAKSEKAIKLYRTAWYNPEMHEFILRVLRQQVSGGLLGLANLKKGYLNSFDTWDAAQVHSPQTGAFLWLGGDMLPGGDEVVPPPEFATISHKSRPMSIPKKLPVHNLNHLLGQEFLELLKQKTTQIPMFHQPIVALKKRNMTVTLQVQLWALQGYMADHTAMLH
jgi:hypothetical protein